MSFVRSMALLMTLLCVVETAMGDVKSDKDKLEREKASLTFLALTDEKNPVKYCLNQSLILNTAFTAFRMARLSDEEIDKNIRRDIRELNIQDTIMSEWVSSKSPERVAENEFERCLQEEQIPIGDAIKAASLTCFGYAGVAANAEGQKNVGVKKDDAIKAIVRRYNGAIQDAYISSVVKEIYASNGHEEVVLVHRQVYSGCIDSIE